MHSLFTGHGHSSKKYALKMSAREEGKGEKGKGKENMHDGVLIFHSQRSFWTKRIMENDEMARRMFRAFFNVVEIICIGGKTCN